MGEGGGEVDSTTRLDERRYLRKKLLFCQNWKEKDV